jgi:hypothetical protein
MNAVFFFTAYFFSDDVVSDAQIPVGGDVKKILNVSKWVQVKIC